MGKKSKDTLTNNLKNFSYSILSFFCTEQESYAIFDETIQNLNNDLRIKRKYFNIMILLTFIYFFICIYCPYFLTVHYGIFVKTKNGVAWQSHYVYAAFAFLSFLIEVIVYMFVYKQIKDLIPPINFDNFDENNKSLMTKLKLFLKNHARQLKLIFFSSSLFFSQLARFDLYSDVCFIVICFKMEQNIIGIISLVLLSIQMLSNIYKLFNLFFERFIINKKRQLITHEINQLCYLSNLIEFEALNDILEKVAPYNIANIPNNFLLKCILPSLAGKTISNRIFVQIQKFLFEDAIQIALQVAFFISQQEKETTAILSMTASIISMVIYYHLIKLFRRNIQQDFNVIQQQLKAFYKLMSIRPSSLSQLEYDSLSKKMENNEDKYNKQLWKYRDNMVINLQEVIDEKSKPNIIVQ